MLDQPWLNALFDRKGLYYFWHMHMLVGLRKLDQYRANRLQLCWTDKHTAVEPNVICESWANNVANKIPMMTQRMNDI